MDLLCVEQPLYQLSHSHSKPLKLALFIKQFFNRKLTGYAFAWIGMEKIGRRQTMVLSLVTAGVSLLAKSVVDFVGKSEQTFFVWFNLVSRLAAVTLVRFTQ